MAGVADGRALRRAKRGEGGQQSEGQQGNAKAGGSGQGAGSGQGGGAGQQGEGDRPTPVRILRERARAGDTAARAELADRGITVRTWQLGGMTSGRSARRATHPARGDDGDGAA